jgi:hypothetical protein
MVARDKLMSAHYAVGEMFSLDKNKWYKYLKFPTQQARLQKTKY